MNGQQREPIGVGPTWVQQLANVLPKIRTQLQLTGFIVLAAGVVATHVVAPNAVTAQITAGAVGVLFIVFGQVFSHLGKFPPEERTRLILVLFVIFCVFVLSLLVVTIVLTARAKIIPCTGDGNHIRIDLSEISIEYSPSAFAGAINSLAAMNSRLDVVPKLVEELVDASVATQQFNEFLIVLVQGYNSCAVTRQEYANALDHIYSRLKKDGADLESIRKLISEGQNADTTRLETLIDRFSTDLTLFAQAVGKGTIVQQIENIKLAVPPQERGDTQKIVAKLEEVKLRDNMAPTIPTPAEVSKEVSEVPKEPLAKGVNAEQAYRTGYELLKQYSFREAIPYLRQALDDIAVPDFYLALGRAYWELPDLPQAARIVKQGLDTVAHKNDDRHEAALASLLGLILVDTGDLGGALSNIQRALEIDKKAFGPDSPNVATDFNNIGVIQQVQGNLDAALNSVQRAMNIDEKVYGNDHPNVAVDANNIGTILQDKKDLDRALTYTKRALDIDTNFYGPDHHTVAMITNNIAAILRDKRDLDRALTYFQRALNIEEKLYGPDHPNVAKIDSNIGAILNDKGNLDDALGYLRRAFEIHERAYGPNNYDVAVDANNIAAVLKAKGDLDGALTYGRPSLAIVRGLYGDTNPTTMQIADNVRRIERTKEAKQR